MSDPVAKRIEELCKAVGVPLRALVGPSEPTPAVVASQIVCESDDRRREQLRDQMKEYMQKVVRHSLEAVITPVPVDDCPPPLIVDESK